ncbi:CynX/NimT family MFS transporter [Planococcus salinus]|uniref:MFS transporter n=1 Tax=Planococcus salinus TaxID=1848460 RepID=A0A3M8PB16_9BACL|nr:MFS transporter [Planococcus salinus]RNF40420.1 MFS transporter [Planococcus salinus]
MTAQQTKTALGLMVVAIFFVSINLRPAISSIGPVLDVIRADLSLTNSQVSLLTAVPVFCMGLFAPFAVVFNRQFGAQRSVAMLLVVIGAFTLLRGLVPTFPLLFASSFFIGLAIAIISPLLSAMIKQNFPMRTPALIGVYSFGMGLGAALSAGLTGVIYTVADWPVALASWGLLSILGLFFWFRVKQPSHDTESQTRMGKQAPSRLPWKNKRAWYMLLFFGFQSSLFFSLLTWLAPIAIDQGMSVLAAGAVLTVMTGVQLVVNVTLPTVLSKYPNRLLWIWVALAVCTGGILLLMAGTATATWLAAGCFGITLGSLFPLALLMPLDENETADDVNSWTAMIQTGGYIISGTMPFAIGFFYDRFGTHMITLILLLIFTALLALFTVLLSNKESK